MIEQGYLLFDGASHKQALIWLSQNFPAHSLRPLLRGTAYMPLEEVGPILLEANPGSTLYNAWHQGQIALRNAVWLKSDLALYELRNVLQRRLRILSPDGREFWLRLADARPLVNAWREKAQWPDGFWHGIREVWLRDQTAPVLAWVNLTPEHDITVASDSIDAQITLDWPLLEALAKSEPKMQDAPI